MLCPRVKHQVQLGLLYLINSGNVFLQFLIAFLDVTLLDALLLIVVMHLAEHPLHQLARVHLVHTDLRLQARRRLGHCAIVFHGARLNLGQHRPLSRLKDALGIGKGALHEVKL